MPLAGPLWGTGGSSLLLSPQGSGLRGASPLQLWGNTKLKAAAAAKSLLKVKELDSVKGPQGRGGRQECVGNLAAKAKNPLPPAL